MKVSVVLAIAFIPFYSQAFYVAAPSVQRSGTTQLAAVNDRRDFVVSSIATASALLIGRQPAFAAEVDYKAVSSDIANLVKNNPDWGPTIVRLAWHSSGTYDKMSKTGGSGGGTIRFKEELDHGGNAGLEKTAVAWLEPVHKKYEKDGLSYADLYTLAGGKTSDARERDCFGMRISNTSKLHLNMSL